MNKVVRFLIIGWGLLISTVVWAQSPFTVTPRLQAASGSSELSVVFTVPTKHVLYADKRHFEIAEQGVVRFSTPEPYVIKDKFSGKEKKVFGESFTATCVMPEQPQGDLTLKVHFQGCDPANCFFPEDRTFRITPNGTVARLDEEANTAPAQAANAEWRALASGFTVANRGSGYMNERGFPGFLDAAQSGTSGGSGAVAGVRARAAVPGIRWSLQELPASHLLRREGNSNRALPVAKRCHRSKEDQDQKPNRHADN